MKLPRMRKEIFSMATAVFLWAASSAIAPAQQEPAGPGPDQQGQGQMGEPEPGGPPSPNSMSGAYSPDTSNPQVFADQAFLRTTLEDDMAQEKMGQLAAQKSQSPDVKQFGQKTAQIRQQLTHQIAPLARKLGVSQPTEPSKKDREEIHKLQALSGPDFDSAFLRATLKEQESDLKNFKDEESSSDPNIKNMAKMDAPVLNDHLQILERLAQNHNVSEQSSK